MRERANRWDARGFTLAAIVLGFLAVFFLFPLLHATRAAFFVDGQPSLAAFRALAANPALVSGITRSLFVAMMATLLASAVAIPAAWLVTRFRFGGRDWIAGALLVPLVLPPFVGALGLKRLFARYGTVNLVLMRVFGLDTPPIDWLGGDLVAVAVLEALHLYPILYLNLRAALGGIDASLEEAARGLGLGPVAVVRRVLLPLVLPGYLAGAILVFVWAFSDLGTPLFLGVYDLAPVQIFDRVSDITSDPTGFALVLVVIAVSLAAFLLSLWIAPSTRHSAATKGTPRSVAHRLTGGHAFAARLGLGAIVLVAGLPHLGVLTQSFAERWFLTPLPDELSLHAYTLLGQHPLARASIVTSLSLAAAATLVDLALGLIIAIAVTRRTIPLGRWLDTLAMAPLAVPGLVLAFGLMGAFAGTPLDPLTHSPALLLIASYAVRRLPFAVRGLTAGLQSVSPTLEEAARNLGLGPRATLARVTLPLLSPHLSAAALLVFVFAAVEVSDSLVLALRPEDYPMTKAIWELIGRLDDGPMVASAMGVLVMGLLAVGFILVGRMLRGRGSDLFRAGG